MVEEVYRTSGSQNSVPSKNWKDVNGKRVEALSVSMLDTSISTLLEKDNVSQYENITCMGKHGEFLHLEWNDPRICDGVRWDCDMGRDERSCGFHSLLTNVLIVSAQIGANSQSALAKRVSGLYTVEKDKVGNPGYYTHSNGTSHIYRRNGTWVIGPSVSYNKPYYTSKKGDAIPESGWIVATNGGENENLWTNEKSSIRVNSVPNLIADNVTIQEEFLTHKVIICRTKSGGWEYLESGSEKICNSVVDCYQGADEYKCQFHSAITNVSFLILSGTNKGQDGTYEIRNDDLGNPSYFDQINGTGYIIWSQNKWNLADGKSRDNPVFLYQSNSNQTLAETEWEDMTGFIETEIRVTLLPKSINLTMLLKTEEEYEVPEGLLCTERKDNQQTMLDRRLFIGNVSEKEKRKCDGTWHCDKGRVKKVLLSKKNTFLQYTKLPPLFCNIFRCYFMVSPPLPPPPPPFQSMFCF